MVGSARTARKTPGPIWLTAAGTLLCAGMACAQGTGTGIDKESFDAHGLNHSLDITRLLPSFGSPGSGSRTRKSAAASLPDPRALKGANARKAARLRLNLKGFSLLEAREREGTEVRVRRVREREWRRPVLSLTFQKRF